MEVADGCVATLDYTVRLASGDLVDSTGGCGPVTVMVGAGQLFPALEERLAGMRVGETRTFVVPPEDAYGVRRPELVQRLPRERLPPDLELVVGGDYRITGPEGRVLRFRVLEIGPDAVRADFNRPGAGEALNATVTLVAVRLATPEEARRGRV